MNYRFNRAAELELQEAADRYEGERLGLGLEFSQAIAAGISAIITAPERWIVVEPGIRRFLIKRFPYGLFYRIDGNEVEIVAVAHLHRRPGYWRRRI